MRAVAARRGKKSSGGKAWRLFRPLLIWTVAAAAGLYLLCALSMLALRWVDPWTTAVQIERRVEAFRQPGHYHKQYDFVPFKAISLEVQHAVIAAEDGRFYEHNGIDWKQVRKVVDEGIENGEIPRGASTITQQLVKNLYLTTSRSALRKGAEFALVPLAERILGKKRILELYLNVIEWGPGIYGAEAAARYHYKTSAARLGREQSARLAAILPSPRKRKPARMNEYSAEILRRMRQMGW